MKRRLFLILLIPLIVAGLVIFSICRSGVAFCKSMRDDGIRTARSFVNKWNGKWVDDSKDDMTSLDFWGI